MKHVQVHVHYNEEEQQAKERGNPRNKNFDSNRAQKQENNAIRSTGAVRTGNYMEQSMCVNNMYGKGLFQERVGMQDRQFQERVRLHEHQACDTVQVENSMYSPGQAERDYDVVIDNSKKYDHLAVPPADDLATQHHHGNIEESTDDHLYEYIL